MSDNYNVKEIENRFCKPKSKALVDIRRQVGRSCTDHKNKTDLHRNIEYENKR